MKHRPQTHTRHTLRIWMYWCNLLWLCFEEKYFLFSWGLLKWKLFEFVSWYGLTLSLSSLSLQWFLVSITTSLLALPWKGTQCTCRASSQTYTRDWVCTRCGGDEGMTTSCMGRGIQRWLTILSSLKTSRRRTPSTVTIAISLRLEVTILEETIQYQDQDSSFCWVSYEEPGKEGWVVGRDGVKKGVGVRDG